MTMTPEQATRFADIFDRLVGASSRCCSARPTSSACLHGAAERGPPAARGRAGHRARPRSPGRSRSASPAPSNRVQFTPDLLPGDITGVTIYDQRSGAFEFHPGPVFANIVLADEINRASPKTQSALLEVMEEGQVTVDGVTHPSGAVHGDRHPEPRRAGRHLPPARGAARPVPHARLDRVPRPRVDAAHPRGSGQRAHDLAMPPQSRPPRPSSRWPRLPARCTSTRRINDYVSRLVDATRTAPEVRLGVSVRGALALVRTAKTHAAAADGTTSCPTTSSRSPSPCSPTASSWTPRRSSTASTPRT